MLDFHQVITGPSPAPEELEYIYMDASMEASAIEQWAGQGSSLEIPMSLV